MATVWLLFTLAAFGQWAAPEETLGDALRSLASRADVVFVGRVAAIRHEASVAGSAGSMAIDFRVEQTLAGTVGRTYTLHEWRGLWPAGQRRYWTGERVAIFVHAPDKDGLSSPVDGMEGVLPVVQQDATGEPLADVGRLAARLVRTRNEPLAASGSGIKLSELAAFVAHTAGVREPVLYSLPAGVAGPPTAGTTAAQNVDPSKLHALLQPIDPERTAVGESRWRGN
jgi:hypothetical protein